MKKSLLTLLFAVAMFFYACSTSKLHTNESSENKSHYHLLRFHKNQVSDSAVVLINGAKIGGNNETLPSFIIKVNSEEVYSIEGDTTAIIYLSSGTYDFLFLSLAGLYPIRTKKIELSARDSIHINFYSEFKPLH